MVDSYENLEGKIWLDGELVEWKDAKFHLLTHALHYGSSVFEGERAYGGKIYKSYEHSERLKKSAEYVDMQVPYSTDELEIAKRKEPIIPGKAEGNITLIIVSDFVAPNAYEPSLKL